MVQATRRMEIANKNGMKMGPDYTVKVLHIIVERNNISFLQAWFINIVAIVFSKEHAGAYKRTGIDNCHGVIKGYVFGLKGIIFWVKNVAWKKKRDKGEWARHKSR